MVDAYERIKKTKPEKKEKMEQTLKVIAYARNGHTDKFGIPRQSREESPILTRIVFEPEYSVVEALRGIEGYSHLWLVWGFSASRPATSERQSQSDSKTAKVVGAQAGFAVGQLWSPTVRPPRLGGNKRMGVFATRSPFRPNPIGLSSVRLVGICINGELQITNHEFGVADTDLDIISHENGRMELIVSGADVLDGTPIYDIKPYLSFSDSHPDARNGFAEETKDRELAVDWSLVDDSDSADGSITLYESRGNHAGITRESRGNFSMLRRLKEDIEYILRQDPRPGYQNDPEREYKLDYAGLTVTFQVQSEEEEGKENAKGMKSEGGESAKGMKREGGESAKGMSRGKVIVKRIEKWPKRNSVH